MIKPHVLLVDDEPVTLTIIKGWIQEMGYTVDTAESGPSALEALSSTSRKAITMLITDEEMPAMKGSELISIVHDLYPDISCLVVSGQTNRDAIVRAMSEHKALDYLFKPLSKEQLAWSINRTLEFSMIRKKAAEVSQDERAFFQVVRDTFNWKETLRRARHESLASDMINQINIGFFQGKGIGALISSLSMLFSKSKMNPGADGYYQVRDVLFEMARESFEESMIAIKSMSRAQAALTSNHAQPGMLSGRDFYRILQKINDDMVSMLAIKNQRILLGDMPVQFRNESIECDPEQMRTVFQELLMNAMKYSQEGDIIYVLVQLLDACLEVKVVNPAYEYLKGETGICGKYENLVFEPFFRMSKVVDERYVLEELSYGLGLPVAKRIIEQHGGSIFVYTLDNHMNERLEKDVCVSVRLPLRKANALRVSRIAEEGI